MDYKLAIIAASLEAGIDPTVALAVATHESGINQYRADGSVVRGGAGELGIFQVKPSTAPGMDLTNPEQNIKAGVGYLAQLHRAFGEWPLAIAAYNWGEGNVNAAMKGVKTVPASVSAYVAAVLGPGQLGVSVAGMMTTGKVVLGVIFGTAVLLLLMKS
jgi:soluble lytic murein transglycosylase-like protein